VEIFDWIVAHWTEIVAVAGAVVIIARVIVKITPTPKDDAWLAKVLDVLKVAALHITDKKPKVLLLFLLPVLALGGCAQGARHDYFLGGLTFAIQNQESIDTLTGEALTSGKAKVAQDMARLDNALMLEIEALAKRTFATDAERQAAVLALVQKYKASVIEVEADAEALQGRDRNVKELTDATKEALAGMLEIEARSWALWAQREDLLSRAVTGKILDLLKLKGGTK
jgi:hypothetical protein